MWTKKRKGNFSVQPQEQQTKSPLSTWWTLHLWNIWMYPKFRRWTLAANVDSRIAVCDWFVSAFQVYLSLDCSACYHWWICLLVWMLFSFINLFIKFYYFLILIYYLFYLFFLPFFPPFLLSRVADRVLVLQPGVRPDTPRWESRVQDIRWPETSQPHVISISERSPRDPYLNTETQLHPTASKLQCWISHARQLARQEHKPTH